MQARLYLSFFSVVWMSFELVDADEITCPTSKPTTMETRLRNQYMYDTINRPIQQNGNNSVDVRIRLVLKKFDFDVKEDKLEIHSWFVMYWKDCRYSWDPSKFDNIREIRMPSNLLWKPDFADFSTYDMVKALSFTQAFLCILYSNGAVMCVPPYNHVVSCSADLTRWPYDTHTCTMTIGSWTHTGEQLNISQLEPGIVLNGYNLNREWKLASMRSYKEVAKDKCCPNDTFVTASFQFVLQRHPGSYSSTVVFPAVVLMVLTLVTFWMEPSETDRLMLSAVNVLSHILFLQHLGSLLPANGDQTPLMVTFYRDSMFLAAMTLLTAVIVPSLRATTMNLPLWASAFTSWVLHNWFGQVFIFQILGQKNAGSVKDTSGGEDGTPRPNWILFTSLLDFIFFVATLLSYFILLLGYIP
ncbi:neuronal acetylcholine receptor subunit alpha-2-like isoform X2 [Zootermopsis nevadensis]|uniref:neuronal acetylcholine receptor subunit alpha-2-like isoform X2 n=1 Tax=Zootermopsis nevadensis TaxID=136037 RepID=UPI000B8EB8D4|nr:neuronal acetylcholine receptor subunit alpha-2-like isoform X2 [Zootermopsis nevadensis]